MVVLTRTEEGELLDAARMSVEVHAVAGGGVRAGARQVQVIRDLERPAQPSSCIVETSSPAPKASPNPPSRAGERGDKRGRAWVAGSQSFP